MAIVCDDFVKWMRSNRRFMNVTTGVAYRSELTFATTQEITLLRNNSVVPRIAQTVGFVLSRSAFP